MQRSKEEQNKVLEELASHNIFITKAAKMLNVSVLKIIDISGKIMLIG